LRLRLSSSQIHRRPLSIIQPCASSAVWRGPPDQSVWPEVPLHVRWQERKRAGAVVSLDGSTMVKQARVLCRAGTPRRHGLWFGWRSPGGIERKTAAVVAHGTAQLPSKCIRNEQDHPKYVRCSMEHQEEQPIVAAISGCCRLVVDQPAIAQAAISDPGARAFYHLGADC
jgi:hypothetical protein